MNEFERMREGKLYNSSDPDLVKRRLKVRDLVNQYNALSAYDMEGRTNLLKEIFPLENNVKSAFFEPNIRVEYGTNVSFGKNFYMNYDCMLLDVAKISIGDNVMFGTRVMIVTPMHPMLGEERIMQQYPDGFYNIEYAKPVTIGNNVWLASGVIVCPGVTIGDNAVIGAGSVVTRDIPSNVLATGVPCKVIRGLDENDRMNVWDTYTNNK